MKNDLSLLLAATRAEKQPLPPSLSDSAKILAAMVQAIAKGDEPPLSIEEFEDIGSRNALLMAVKQIDPAAEMEGFLIVPSEALQATVDDALADLHINLNDLARIAQVVTQFMALKAWNGMKANPIPPNDFELNYFFMHKFLDDLGLHAHSPETYELLGTNEHQFKTIDQDYALNHLFSLFKFQQQISYGRNGDVKPVAALLASEDTQFVKRWSDITDEQIYGHIENMRMLMEAPEPHLSS